MVPPARSRSEEIDGNSAVVSAGAVRLAPHSFPASARYGSQHHGHLRGVVVAGRARAPAQSLLGTSAGSLLGTSAVQPCSTIRMISAVCSSSAPTTSTSASWARIFSPTSLYRLALISFEPPPPPLPLSPPPPALEPVQAASSGPRLSPPSTPSPPPLWTMATFYDQSLAPLKYDDGGTLLSRIAATATSWGRLGHWCDVATPRLSSISLSSASRLFGFAQPVAPRRSARIAARG
mmetsp:Transcript_40451/g.127910  ORF Transcript_40451/g.127910 Transcript_40451/m.127910 type:complete len:235 (+) Transcript_40451:2448-3152(+)